METRFAKPYTHMSAMTRKPDHAPGNAGIHCLSRTSVANFVGVWGVTTPPNLAFPFLSLPGFALPSPYASPGTVRAPRAQGCKKIASMFARFIVRMAVMVRGFQSG